MHKRRWTVGIVSFVLLGSGIFTSTAMAGEQTGATISTEAVPEALTHQGRLVDDEGQPMTGDVELTYTIWDHPTEGAVLWQDVVDVELDDTGFYSVQLGGEDNPIDAAVLADGQGWMGVAVDGDDEMDPRITLNSVPYAVAADEAVRAGEAAFAEEAGGVVDGSIGTEALADDFQLEQQHIDEATGETLEGLSCANGDIARFDGTAWGCDDAVAHAATADEADHATTADEADHAVTAEVAEGVETASIDSDALSADFSVTPGQVDGDTLGGLSCASGQVARFDGNDWFCDQETSGVTEVTAAGPLASSGGDTPNISIDRADEDTDGYLAAEDFASFDDRIESIDAGAGISVAGDDISPEVAVEFGDEPGTAVEGDDPRLDDPRDPLPGSDHYIHNDPDATQDASIDIEGDALVDGQVGVGTDDPQADLDVDGELRVDGQRSGDHWEIVDSWSGQLEEEEELQLDIPNANIPTKLRIWSTSARNPELLLRINDIDDDEYVSFMRDAAEPEPWEHSRQDGWVLSNPGNMRIFGEYMLYLPRRQAIAGTGLAERGEDVLEYGRSYFDVDVDYLTIIPYGESRSPAAEFSVEVLQRDM